MIRFIIVCLLSIFSYFSSVAQPNEKAALDALNALYNARIDTSAFIFTGAEYINQSFLKEGNPFFLVDSLSSGYIRYAGLLYKNIPLQWDILQNYVLTRSLNGYTKIILQNDLIDSFSIAGHNVIRLDENRDANLYNADFYDVLYRGKTEVYARRKIDTYTTFRDNKIVYHFKDKDKFYIKKMGIFYRVGNKRDVLRVFSAHAAAINRAVRKEGLNWRKNFETALLIAATQYDESTH